MCDRTLNEFNMADENQSTALNIVFIPPKEVADYSVSLCQEVAKNFKVNFNLDGSNNFPHITIYQLIIPDKNLKELIRRLDQIAKNLRPQFFEFTDFEVHFGFLGASFKLTDSIKTAQKKVVEGVTDLREGKKVLEVNDPRVESWPKSHKQIVARYGFDNLFDFYNPHITITRLVDLDRAKKLTGKLNWPFGEFDSNSIGLYSLGEFGTCNKLIREFKLKAAS